MQRKKLTDISLPITEKEYREDGCMHYSTIAKYSRTGFHCIAQLNDKIESPSLTNGSAVDSLITGGQKEFDEKFVVVDIPAVSPSIVKITSALYNTFKEQYFALSEIPKEVLVSYWDTYDGRKWKAETKANNIINEGSEYYKLKFIADGKTILTTQDYNIVRNQVKALKESPATSWYFIEDNPFDNIERYYQPIFRMEHNGIQYSCMMDLVIVDHDNKIIYPVDLKTSSHFEDEFYKSFIDWSYK